MVPSLGRILLVASGPPEDFYQRHRWGWPDIVAVLLIVVPPLAAFGFLALRFARSSSPLQPAAAGRST